MRYKASHSCRTTCERSESAQESGEQRYISNHQSIKLTTEFQARSKDQEILEEGGGAGPSTLPRRDHE